MDQQVAIKFIYDNADKIVGDRNRITIVGESAGSISSPNAYTRNISIC